MKIGVAEPRHGGAETRRLGNMGRMEKTIATVLHEAHRLQVEEAVEVLKRGRRASTRAAWIGVREGLEYPLFPPLAPRADVSRGLPRR